MKRTFSSFLGMKPDSSTLYSKEQTEQPANARLDKVSENVRRRNSELWKIVRDRRALLIPAKKIKRSQAPRPPYMISPTSNSKTSWDLVIALLVLYTTVVVPYRVGFNQRATGFLAFFEVAADIFFFIDICVNFRTGVIDPITNLIRYEKKVIIKTYVTGWFTIDLLSTFPFEDAFLLLYNGSISSNTLATTQLIRTAKALRLMKIFRFRKLGMVFQTAEEKVAISSSVLALFKVVVFVLFVSHIMACVWFFITQGVTDEPTWAQAYRHEAFPALNEAELVMLQYIASLYWSLSTMTTIGYGDIIALNNTERLLSVFVMVLSVSVFGYVISNIASLLENLNAHTRLHREKMTTIKEYLIGRTLPSKLSAHIREHFEYYYTQRSVFNEDDIIDSMPSIVRQDAILHVMRNQREKITLLKIFPKGLAAELAILMQPFSALDSEDIYRQHEIAAHVFFISRGVVKLKKAIPSQVEDIVLSIAAAGSHFGELEVFHPRYGNGLRLCTASAKGYCELVFISRQDILKVNADWPELEAHFLNTADKAATLMRKRANIQSSHNHTVNDSDENDLAELMELSDEKLEEILNLAHVKPQKKSILSRGSIMLRGGRSSIGKLRTRRNATQQKVLPVPDDNESSIISSSAADSTMSDNNANTENGGEELNNDAVMPFTALSKEEDSDDNESVSSVGSAVSLTDDSTTNHNNSTSAVPEVPPGLLAQNNIKLKKQKTVKAMAKNASSRLLRKRGSTDNYLHTSMPFLYKMGSSRSAKQLFLQIQVLRKHGLWHPQSTKRTQWDLVLTAAIIYSTIIVPFRIGFDADAQSGWYYFELSMDVFFFFDIIVNFRTAYFNQDRELVYDRLDIAERYVRGFFILDLLSTLPLDLIANVTGDGESKAGGAIKSAKLLKVLRLARLLKLVRLLKLGAVFTKVKEMLQINPSIERLVKLSIILCFFGHWNACLFHWNMLAREQSNIPTWCTDYFFPKMNDTVIICSEAVSLTDRYVAALYWAFASMTTVGFGDVKPNRFDIQEMEVAMVGMLLNATVFGYVISGIMNVINNFDPSSRELNLRLNNMKDYVRDTCMPDSLGTRVRKHYESLLRRTCVFDEEAIFDSLRPSLRFDAAEIICEQTTLLDIEIVSSMERSYRGLVSYLMFLMKPVFLRHGDLICEKGNPGKCSFFITKGACQQSTLKPGSEYVLCNLQFEEYAVLADESERYRYQVTAKVLSPRCHLYSLSRDDFAKLAKLSPMIQKHLRYLLSLSVSNNKNDLTPDQWKVVNAGLALASMVPKATDTNSKDIVTLALTKLRAIKKNQGISTDIMAE